MGNEMSKKYLGHRSKVSTGLILSNTELDYKDSKHARQAKNELYELFLADKILHIDSIQDEIESIDQLKIENDILKAEIAKLKFRDVPEKP